MESTSRTPESVTDTPGSQTYQDRLENAHCTYSNRCKRPLADGSSMCLRHLKRERRRVAKTQKAARKNNRELGLCAFCPTKSETYRCPSCAIKHRQIPTSRTPESVTVDAPTKDPWRRDSDGWERYRGKGRRGPPPQSKNDAEDLASALAELERGRQALLYAHSEPVKQSGRHTQNSAKAEAASILALAGGFIAEVVQRNDPERGRAIALLRQEISGDAE